MIKAVRSLGGWFLLFFLTRRLLAGAFVIPQPHTQPHSKLASQSLVQWRRTTQQPSIHLSATPNDDNNKSRPRRRRRRRLRKRIRSWLLAMAVSLLGARPPAHAKLSYELQEQPTHSLRPGMTKQQAEELEQGELDVSQLEAPSALSTQPAQPEKQFPGRGFDYGEDEYDDDEEDYLLYPTTPTARQSDQAATDRMQTKNQFAATYKPKTVALTAKVAVGFFIPTYGTLIVREYVRRRREEAYVKKGLEILEAQKAEYFNVTATTPDSDVQDALKGLKKNETKSDDDDDNDDDDDDDDDEDDDDEEEPPQSRRKGPRRPRGDGDDDSSGGGSDSDPGYGKPSDEDLDKLNRMFGKS